jgi:hypothetical protein
LTGAISAAAVTCSGVAGGLSMEPSGVMLVTAVAGLAVSPSAGLLE